jgi:long-chain acyl-CoA synthetase
MMVTLDLPQLYSKLEPLFGKTSMRRMIVCKLGEALPLIKRLAYPYARKKDIAVIPQDDRHIRYEQLIANDGRFEKPRIDAQRDIAVLQYTGGTTGVPKGAMLTHANLYANTIQSRLIFPNAHIGQERMLGVLPFFHVFAMTAVMNFAIKTASCIIMLPRFELLQVIKTIHAKKPTLFPAVPTIYTAICNFPLLKQYDLSSIRYCISGGAGLPVEIKRDFEKLTGCVVVEGYGLSESSPVATCNPVDGENRAGSIGIPVAGTYIDIISLEDGKTAMPIGERGEVCIRGPQVMRGYWKNDAESKIVLKDTPDGPRLHTGDVGYMDADGYTYIVDRIKDVIIAGGFKIFPRNVEEVIYLHDAVEECIVAGVRDDYRGETVKAFVKLKEGQNLAKEQLIDFLKDKLSPIEMPKQVEFRDKPLPRTMIGKLSRKMLLEEEAAKDKA